MYFLDTYYMPETVLDAPAAHVCTSVCPDADRESLEGRDHVSHLCMCLSMYVFLYTFGFILYMEFGIHLFYSKA